jgi:hypothetical protein
MHELLPVPAFYVAVSQREIVQRALVHVVDIAVGTRSPGEVRRGFEQLVEVIPLRLEPLMLGFLLQALQLVALKRLALRNVAQYHMCRLTSAVVERRRNGFHVHHPAIRADHFQFLGRKQFPVG